MYLVDTNVISAGARSRRAPAELIAHGVAKLRREGATRRSADLAIWLEALLHLYGERVLPLDAPTARIAGALSDRAPGQGQAPGLADIIIAATAQRHGLTILSRNVRHFAPLGVPALDPFAAPPQA